MFETTVNDEYVHAHHMGLNSVDLVGLRRQVSATRFCPRRKRPCSWTNFTPATAALAWYNACDESSCLGNAEAYGFDPQGQAIQHALSSLGFSSVRDVRQGKFFVLDLDGASREAAEKQIERVAREVLTNPVIEEFRYEIVE